MVRPSRERTEKNNLKLFPRKKISFHFIYLFILAKAESGAGGGSCGGAARPEALTALSICKLWSPSFRTPTATVGAAVFGFNFKLTTLLSSVIFFPILPFRLSAPA